jgi:hypothetical protein
MLDDMQAWLRGLNDAQIRFKPADRQFSIAEIVTHSCFSDEMFLGWLALLAQSRAAEIDPALLIGGAGARNEVSRLDLEAMNEACRRLARNTIESRLDPADLAATAPHPYFGALNAKGWLYFMALHRGMHRRQCERVIDAPGFPRSTSFQTQPREAYQPAERKTWLAQETEGKPQEVIVPHTVTAKPRTATKKVASKTAAVKRTATKKAVVKKQTTAKKTARKSSKK